jgi:hypothetical protein
MRLRLLVALVLLSSIALAQRAVDPKFTYHRVICVVPLVGSGTAEDPKRPKYAPLPDAQVPNDIIGFTYLPTDDGASAVVEFVARTRAGLQFLFDDQSIKPFELGRVAKDDIESAIRQQRKDFDLNKFGLVMP